MNRRLLTILLCALVVSGGSSYIVYRIVGRKLQVRPQAQVQTSRVVVAKRNLEVGAVLAAPDLQYGEWVGALPSGAVSSAEALIGRGVVSPLYAGEPVLEIRLAAPGSGGGLAATIPPGMRACAVRVNDVVGVAGFVLPGMRVDVLISGTPPGGTSGAGSRVRTLLQNIQVLSAGAQIQKDNEGKPVQAQVVNLLVTPEQAELLSLAGNETRIQLVLRNPLDTVLTRTRGSATAALFDEDGVPVKAAPQRVRPVPVSAPPPPVVVPASRQVYVIEVLNGSKRTETRVTNEEEPSQPGASVPAASAAASSESAALR